MVRLYPVAKELARTNVALLLILVCVIFDSCSAFQLHTGFVPQSSSVVLGEKSPAGQTSCDGHPPPLPPPLVSISQIALHQSLSSVFPSSHCSGVSTIALPHTSPAIILETVASADPVFPAGSSKVNKKVPFSVNTCTGQPSLVTIVSSESSMVAVTGPVTGSPL